MGRRRFCYYQGGEIMNLEQVCPYCLSTEILLSYQFCYCKDCGEETKEPLLLEETNEETNEEK